MIGDNASHAIYGTVVDVSGERILLNVKGYVILVWRNKLCSSPVAKQIFETFFVDCFNSGGLGDFRDF